MRRTKQVQLLVLVATLSVLCPSGAVELTITPDGQFFALDDKPTFLQGISYFNAGSASSQSKTADLNDMQKQGFNWLRTWIFWDKWSALTDQGEPIAPYFDQLLQFVSDCNDRGIVVDITLIRGSTSPSMNGPQNQAQHVACLKTLAHALLQYRNVYFDISNEHNQGNVKHVSSEEMAALIATVKSIDPKRLCTGSTIGFPPIADVNATKYDFITPHLARCSGCEAKIYADVVEYKGKIKSVFKRNIPIHLQEPERRDWTKGHNPTADDFYRMFTGTKAAFGAGWCFHNGDNKTRKEPYLPWRSFNMSDSLGRLYDQFDDVETVVAGSLAGLTSKDAYTINYHPEYVEQLSHTTGTILGGAVFGNASKDIPGLLTNGPAVELQPGSFKVEWRLRLLKSHTEETLIGSLKVRNVKDGSVLGSRNVTSVLLSDRNYTAVAVQSTLKGTAAVDFVFDWNAKASVYVERVDLVLPMP